MGVVGGEYEGVVEGHGCERGDAGLGRRRLYPRVTQQLPNRREARAGRKPSVRAALRGWPALPSISGGAPGFRVSAPVRRGPDARPEWLSGRSSGQRSRR